MYFEITINANFGTDVYKIRVTPKHLKSDGPIVSYLVAAYEKCEHEDDNATWLTGFECHGRVMEFVELETPAEVFEYIQMISEDGNPNSWAY